MKKFVLLFISLLTGFLLFGQELEGERKVIRAESPEMEAEIPLFERVELKVPSYGIGAFDPRRYPLPYSLEDIGFPRDEKVALDIMAISQAQHRDRQSMIRSVEVSRQLQQIKAQVQVFNERDRDSWNRANDNLRFNSKITPDGGIRNRALHDLRRPFTNPYYGLYNPGYYNYYRPYYYYR